MAILRPRSALWTRSPEDQTDSEIKRARRLMSYAEEFEDRWFWETDPDGNLTYLSKSVGEQIDLFGIKTVGAPIKDVFQIDQSEREHARTISFGLANRISWLSCKGAKRAKRELVVHVRQALVRRRWRLQRFRRIRNGLD